MSQCFIFGPALPSSIPAFPYSLHPVLFCSSALPFLHPAVRLFPRVDFPALCFSLLLPFSIYPPTSSNHLPSSTFVLYIWGGMRRHYKREARKMQKHVSCIMTILCAHSTNSSSSVCPKQRSSWASDVPLCTRLHTAQIWKSLQATVLLTYSNYQSWNQTNFSS